MQQLKVIASEIVIGMLSEKSECKIPHYFLRPFLFVFLQCQGSDMRVSIMLSECSTTELHVVPLVVVVVFVLRFISIRPVLNSQFCWLCLLFAGIPGIPHHTQLTVFNRVDYMVKWKLTLKKSEIIVVVFLHIHIYFSLYLSFGNLKENTEMIYLEENVLDTWNSSLENSSTAILCWKSL